VGGYWPTLALALIRMQ
jgi:hypothetical protein